MPVDFLSEVRDQPRALQHLLDACASESVFREVATLSRGRQMVVFSGMGASLFSSYPAATYLTERGVRCQCLDAGELLHYGLRAVGRSSTLAVLVSQSGESYEILALAQRLRNMVNRPAIMAVTNDGNSSLTRLADLTLCMEAGPEHATTSKTYVNSIALLLLMAVAIAGDSLAAQRRRLAGLPDQIGDLIRNGLALGREVVNFLSPECYLPLIARGPSVSSALHGALVLKEAAVLGAEGFTGGGFRHGPFEMVGPNLRAIIFAGGRTAKLNLRLADTIAGLGSRVVVVVPTHLPRSDGILSIALPNADEFELPILEIVPVQFLAIVLGRQRGQEPGALRLSGKVVRAEVV